MKINLDRAPRKMASPPQPDSRAFTVVTNSYIHAIFDAQMPGDAQDGCTKLSRDPDSQNPLRTDPRNLFSG